MVGQQAALGAAHAEVVHQDGAGGGRGGEWVEWCLGRVCAGGNRGGEELGDGFVQGANFVDEGEDELGLVGGEMGEGEGAFGVLGLFLLGIS